MLRTKWISLVMAAALAIPLALPARARAQTAAAGTPQVTTAADPTAGSSVGAGGPVMSPNDSDADVDRWWGVAGTVLCGGGVYLVRRYPEIGMEPWVLAATIGGCILMAMDVFSTT